MMEITFFLKQGFEKDLGESIKKKQKKDFKCSPNNLNKI